MARLFLSHSSGNSAEAIALRGWLMSNGWDDIFLDLDPERGLRAGQRWQAALRAAVDVCEAVLFLISPDWCASKWCFAEFLLAMHLNKKIFCVIVAPTPRSQLPPEITAEWQYVDLTVGGREQVLTVDLPETGPVSVAFAKSGLDRLRLSLVQTRLEPRYFDWPPFDDPDRPPFPGLRNLAGADAGIFFGREAPVLETIDRLRGIRALAPPRFMVILGASGAGKSSFLHAGLIPRLERQQYDFLPLPTIRPSRDPCYGETGLLRALELACSSMQIQLPRSDLRQAIAHGRGRIRQILSTLQAKRIASLAEGPSPPAAGPTLLLAIDQAEELFNPESRNADTFLKLINALIAEDAPPLIALFVIRSDRYEMLQTAPHFSSVRQLTYSLPPIPSSSYGELIRGPLRRLATSRRRISIDENLADAITNDMAAGNARDALPLLAYTLGQLYDEFGGGGQITLVDYERFGRVGGSIDRALEQAFERADNDPRIPRDPTARKALLRRGFIPWLAGLDPETSAPRRRVARYSEIPEESRPLIGLLVEQRLVTVDRSERTAETTVEVAHEVLLRQWGLLQGWLAEDAGLLGIMEGVKRASRDWAANAQRVDWAVHTRERLRAVDQVLSRADIKSGFEPTDFAYLKTCRTVERTATTARRRLAVFVTFLSLITILGVIGWIFRPTVEKVAYRLYNFWPYVLNEQAQVDLRPLEKFRECAEGCPVMIVLPPGRFDMGSKNDEADRGHDEGPQHDVAIPKKVAVSVFEITFDEWDACVRHGRCPASARDYGWGRGRRPVIYVSWFDARVYADWISEQTGARYRLLSEAEWEYAARAGGMTPISADAFAGSNLGNCAGCGSEWDGLKTAPVGSFKPNAFGLYDLQGNVWEWVADCWREEYSSTSAIDVADCERRVLRGGAWNYGLEGMRPAFRYASPPVVRNFAFGFRIARDLQ